MSADVITTYSHVAWCADCGYLSQPVQTIEEATRLATDHNILRHGGEGS